jgi:hypothetical protein
MHKAIASAMSMRAMTARRGTCQRVRVAFWHGFLNGLGTAIPLCQKTA